MALAPIMSDAGVDAGALVKLFAILAVALVFVLKLTRRSESGRICRKCGASHPTFANFCRRCGKEL